jgi:hypothetical protein
MSKAMSRTLHRRAVRHAQDWTHNLSSAANTGRRIGATLYVEEARVACLTCEAIPPGDEELCLSCRLYWEDVQQGLFE